MTALCDALTLGLVLALAALGVRVAFRVLRIVDVGVDGTFALSAVATALLATRLDADPGLALAAGLGVGVAAGLLTGALHALLRLEPLLAGVVTMAALLAAALHLAGTGIGLADAPTLTTLSAPLAERLLGRATLHVLGWPVAAADVVRLGVVTAVVVTAGLATALLLRTHAGLAMRAAGEAPAMLSAVGTRPERWRVLGLVVANALVGLAGALWAQCQGAADAWTGVGTLAWSLAAIVVADVLTGEATPGVGLAATMLSSVLLRLLVGIALGLGLLPGDPRLVAALVVVTALGLLGRTGRRPEAVRC
jgi:putative ABC transport system permease protein